MRETAAGLVEPIAVIDEAAAIVEAEWMRLIGDDGSCGPAAADLPAARRVPLSLRVLTREWRMQRPGRAVESRRCPPARRRATRVWPTQRSPPVRRRSPRAVVKHGVTHGR